MVVGDGVSGSVVVGEDILPVAGGTEAIIEQNRSGQDELSTIESDTATTSILTSTSIEIKLNVKLEIKFIDIKLNGKPNTLQHLPQT